MVQEPQLEACNTQIRDRGRVNHNMTLIRHLMGSPSQHSEKDTFAPSIKRRNTLINDEESISQFKNMARSIEQVDLFE